MRRTTLKDIAEIAGVNPSTVSRALKDHPDISDAIKNEIKRIAENLKYHPNQFAANLRLQRSNFIALIIPEITMFFFPSLIRGIEEVVKKEGYQLMVLQSNDSNEIEKRNINHCFDQSVDGILISLSCQTKNIDHLIDAESQGIPVVVFDKTLENSTLDEIIIDDELATKTCIDYLISTGKKRIAGIFGNPSLSITQKRTAGFKASLSMYEDTEKNFLHIKHASNIAEGKKVTEEIIANYHPDAIFVMSDELIAASFSALTEMGINIPGECALIGISDGTLPHILNPKITFLHHDAFAEGVASAKRLFERIKNSDELVNNKQRIVLATRLILQQSA